MAQKNKHKSKTVSDKITDLIVRPNAEDSAESDDEINELPRVVDFEEDYELPDAKATEFRKRNIKLLSQQSERYRGKLASRKDFISDEESEASINSEDDEYEHSNDSKDALKEAEESASNASSDMDEVSENEQSDFDESEEDYDGEVANTDSEDDNSDEDDSSDEDEEADNTTEMVAEKNIQKEMQKGLCVQNQVRIWEKLLELRIQSQKLLTKANQLPIIEDSTVELTNTRTETTQKLGVLLNSFLTLQSALTNQFSELKSNMQHSLKRPSPFVNNEMPPVKRIATHLQERFKEFQTYRNQVLLKWDDRTKLLAPGAGSKKKSLHDEFNVLQKIDNALMNRSTLIEKSQLLKNNTKTAENNNEDDEDSETPNPNIYDDSEFYHQQLRELIEYKANTSTSMMEVTKQMLELQKLRQKMKKNVDTRASKGRKLRYMVHNKLISFMAPIDDTTWTDESKDELYKSLFV
ncbi:protein Aatf [Teleopsis dalmanni]|uniref:protein Aatf n=1 Tax=Teleopsis dalmanni TaxID=139649 RepID=UPI000D329C12|nr:protein Aatf [Teleopsis dalmanni]